jgi:hypothetical protein
MEQISRGDTLRMSPTNCAILDTVPPNGDNDEDVPQAFRPRMGSPPLPH